MVASDYEVRLRAPDASLTGRPDLFVILELCVYGLVATFLLLVVASHAPRLRHPPALLFWMWAYAFVLAGSAAYAVYPKLAVARGAQLLIVCGLGQAIYSHARADQIHQLAHAFIALVTASILVGILYRFPQPAIQRGRFNWLYVHPVIAATYMGIAVVLLAAYLRWPDLHKNGLGWRSATYVGLFAFNAGGLLLSRTRGAAAGCIVGLLVLSLVSTSRKTRQGFLLVVSTVALTVVLAGSGPIVRFVQRGNTTEELATLSSRTGLWQEAFNLFSAQPVFGYGLGATRGLFLDTIGLGGGHNGFINVLTDAGLVGLVAWLALLVALAKAALVRRRAGAPLQPESVLIIAVFGMLILNSFTTEGLGAPANVANLWLFVLCGWVGVLRRETTLGDG